MLVPPNNIRGDLVLAKKNANKITKPLPIALIKVLEERNVCRDRHISFFWLLTQKYRVDPSWPKVAAPVQLHHEWLRRVGSSNYLVDIIGELEKAKVIKRDPRYYPTDSSGPGKAKHVTVLDKKWLEGPGENITLSGPRFAKKWRDFGAMQKKMTQEAIDSSPVGESIFEGVKNVRMDKTYMSDSDLCHMNVLRAEATEPFLNEDYGGRLYHQWSNVPSKIRAKSFKILGEELVDFDLKQSYFLQSILLYQKSSNADPKEMRFLRDLYTKGDVYLLLSPGDRDLGKRRLSTFLCKDRTTKKGNSIAEKYFNRDAPNYARFVYVNRDTTDKPWATWVRQERKVLNQIYSLLAAGGLSGRYLDNHDGFMIQESEAAAARSAINTVLGGYKLGVMTSEYPAIMY